MPLQRDRGFANPVLYFSLFVFLSFPIFIFYVRRKWRLAAKRKEEVIRLVVLASQEAARAEIEASVEYSGSFVGNRPQCAVCYSATTTRCARCKAVRYCSGKCQIIHWRQGHKEECRPASITNQFDGAASELDKRSGLHTAESYPKDNNLESEGGERAKPTDDCPRTPALSNSRGLYSNFSGKDDARIKPCALANEAYLSSVSSLTGSLLDIEHNKKLVDVSVSEDPVSNIYAESSTSSDTSSIKSITDSVEANPAKSSASDFTRTTPINNISSSSKLKHKETSISTETVNHESSSSSCSNFDTSDECKVAEACSTVPKILDSNCNSSGVQSASHIDSTSSSMRGENGCQSDNGTLLQFSFSLSGEAPPSASQSSNPRTSISDDACCSSPGNEKPAAPPLAFRASTLRTVISDDAYFSSSGNGKPGQGAASVKKLTADLPLIRTAPTLGSERSSSLVAERGIDGHLMKPRAQRSFSSGTSACSTSNGRHSFSNISSSKAATSQPVPARFSESSAPNGSRSFLSGTSAGPTSNVRHSSASVTSSKADTRQPVSTRLPETPSSTPSGSNGLKTSMRKVVQQFKAAKLSKHYQLGFGSEVAGKYNYKMLFPYDLFVKLYNDKVELQPCGLTNCGNSCYANVVLQCLAFTRPLTAYLLQGLHAKTCPEKEWCFTCEFDSLLLKAKEGKSPLSPIKILSQIQNIGSNLGHGREEDAHEFLRYAIDKMQSVCLKEAGGSAVGPFAKETTLIQLIFGGYLRSKIKCMKCLGKSERHERMMDLTVQIQGDIGTLEEALAQFTATEILDGDNKYQCSRCKSYEKAKKKLTILEAPNVLTIALKRFQSGKFGKLNKPVRFPEILNLTPYMSGTSDKSPVYRLYAVVVHLDVMNAAFSGHYISYVKNSQGKWYKIDDSKVKPVELDGVLSKGAYMLLYARCSPHAPSLMRNAMTKKSKCTETISSGHNEKSSFKARSSSSGSHFTLPASHRPEHYRETLDGPTNFDSFGPMDGRFLRIHRIPKVDSSSDNSSLFSCSDEGSCSTESTRDSTSTDESSGYMLGDSGYFSWNSLLRDDSDASSCSTFSRPSPLSVSNRRTSNSPEHSYSTWAYISSTQEDAFCERVVNYGTDAAEADGCGRQQSRGVLQRKENSSLVYSDTTEQHRKLTDSNSNSSSQTDWEILGRVNPSGNKYGVTLRRCRDTTTQTFY